MLLAEVAYDLGQYGFLKVNAPLTDRPVKVERMGARPAEPAPPAGYLFQSALRGVASRPQRV